MNRQVIILTYMFIGFSCVSRAPVEDNGDTVGGDTVGGDTVGGDTGSDSDLLPPSTLLTPSAFSYKGAFLLEKNGTYGESDNKYAGGVFELSAAKSSFYFVGRKTDGVIGEFELPELIASEDISLLKTANVVRQPYSSVVNYGNKSNGVCSENNGVTNRVPTGNPQCIDRITGLALYGDSLIANVTMYYDGAADNTHTTLLISDASDLAGSELSGFFSLEGIAHASGWISEIPASWQSALGGKTLMGWAANFPIAARGSPGPTAFVVDLNDINSSSSTDTPISTTALMDFSLTKKLREDPYNNNSGNTNTLPVTVGDNNLWTAISWAVYGFIVPGTKTYAVFGSSGGHNSGLGYKITQSNGNLCGGPCAAQYDDYYNYYWFFDVEDFVAVKNGNMEPYEMRPYSYGVFEVPFQNEAEITDLKFTPIRPIRGGDYDKDSSTLYLVLGGSLQERQVIVAYDVTVN